MNTPGKSGSSRRGKAKASTPPSSLKISLGVSVVEAASPGNTRRYRQPGISWSLLQDYSRLLQNTVNMLRKNRSVIPQYNIKRKEKERWTGVKQIRLLKTQNAHLIVQTTLQPTWRGFWLGGSERFTAILHWLTLNVNWKISISILQRGNNGLTDCPHRIRRDGLSKGERESAVCPDRLKAARMPTFTRKEGAYTHRIQTRNRRI